MSYFNISRQIFVTRHKYSNQCPEPVQTSVVRFTHCKSVVQGEISLLANLGIIVQKAPGSEINKGSAQKGHRKSLKCPIDLKCVGRKMACSEHLFIICYLTFNMLYSVTVLL